MSHSTKLCVKYFTHFALRKWGINVGVVDKILLTFDRTCRTIYTHQFMWNFRMSWISGQGESFSIQQYFGLIIISLQPRIHSSLYRFLYSFGVIPISLLNAFEK